jgi:hypothetical protein
MPERVFLVLFSVDLSIFELVVQEPKDKTF